VVNYVSAQRDVTHELILEESLRQAQKMEAVGRLAGGVAHDFNNILTVINGYTELLLTRHADNPELQNRDLHQIKLAAERAASLTRQLLAFSRKQILQPKMLNLNTVVSDMNMMLHRLIGEDLELITILEPQLGQVLADPGQLEQVIMNLAVNARDAMPKGGKLILQTANINLDGSDTPRYPDVGPGPYVLLAVSDTGRGMTKEVQAHIFEPFFTTKEVGKGTGLGLATVHGIVEQSDGHIWVESEPGLGTTFNIYLPRREATETAQTADTPHRAAQGVETVLLVEDEEQVREFAHRILEMSGYRVLAAPNGPAALTLVDQELGPIDLLLTDMIMPGGLNGLELAQYLRGRRPQLKVIYMSGYTDDALIDRSLFTPDFTFLQKPFNAASLTGKLREVLNTNQT
jgi:nitrogen-specific signal transduction histidine kinase/ActR/RegA family two-component response regulator